MNFVKAYMYIVKNQNARENLICLFTRCIVLASHTTADTKSPLDCMDIPFSKQAPNSPKKSIHFSPPVQGKCPGCFS